MLHHFLCSADPAGEPLHGIQKGITYYDLGVTSGIYYPPSLDREADPEMNNFIVGYFGQLNLIE